MGNASVVGIRAANRHFAGSHRLQLELADDLPDVPALPETLLQMELQLHEFSIDLNEISQLVLTDLGATLQILRMAALESGDAVRPGRIEDCISFLGLEACLSVAGRRTVLSEARQRGVIEVWAHGREIAQLCRKLVSAADSSILPEEAYLVGLTHILGVLPGILGWHWPEDGANNWANKGVRLAEIWSLPLCVQEFFAEVRSDAMGRWSGIVQKAHSMARVALRCPMCEVVGPQMLRQTQIIRG